MFPWEKEAKIESLQKDNEANRAKQATWASRHREEKREKDRRYRTENPDHVREWRAANPDRVKEHQRKQYSTEEHRQYMREYMKKYRAANKKPSTGEKKVGRPRKSDI
ncbi:MAG: hypothetical protein J5601_06750 [Elusimicrobiaceae bacterium]|nr:hypothetical protein [Elusimicrobiaceae bacterium]